MNINDFSDLIKQISIEPSILLLGQNYLGCDADLNYYGTIQERIGQNNEDKKATFSDIFDICDKNKTILQLIQEMGKLSSNVGKVSWLNKMLAFRWNLVYTSAVDGLVQKNFDASVIKRNQQFNEKLFSKQQHLVEIYGSVLNEDNDNPLPKSNKDRKNKVSYDQLSFIKQIVEPYGVLVIEGWKNSDWLSGSKLFEYINQRECPGTYFFGITRDELIDSVSDDDVRDEIIERIDSGFIIVENNSFFEELTNAGYFDEHDEDGENSEDGAFDYYNITFYSEKSKGLPGSLKVRKRDLKGLPDNITLIHDVLTGFHNFNEDELEDAFAHFLIQGDSPNWGFYYNNPPFIFRRTIEDELLQEVKDQLSASTYRRLPILLQGVSNSGKSVTLIKLALNINKSLDKNRAVVFFVSGTPEKLNWKEILSEIIKEKILGSGINENQAIRRIVLICDNIGEDISVVQNELQDSNVLVVGSGFLNTITKYPVKVHTIDAKLDKNEKDELTRILDKFDDVGYSTLSKRFVEKHSCIFEILNRYARFKHDRMWIDVEEHLKGKLRAESQYTENDSGLAYFKETQDVVLKNGIGISIMQNLESDTINSENTQKYIDKIVELNQVLATAGQFGKTLPFDIILKILREGVESSLIRVKFYQKILQLDSMADYEVDSNTGNAFVKFRNPSEAFKYLEMNFNDINQRHSMEIECLKKIIKVCNWSDDYNPTAVGIIDLIRCFGPNSYGRPFEDGYISKNEEYVDLWPDIANSLGEANGLKTGRAKNGEALMVYCHFMREYLQSMKRSDNNIEDKFNCLFDNYNCLVNYIDNIHDDVATGMGRNSRVCGELCSYLNVIMGTYLQCKDLNQQSFADKFKNNFGTFENGLEEFEKYYKKMLRFSKKDTRHDNDSNSQLDIWLNAVINFRNNGIKSDAENEKYGILMMRSLENIGSMLNCNTRSDISRLLEKVTDVFKFFNGKELTFFDMKKLENNSNDSMIYLKMMKPFFDNFEELPISDNPRAQKRTMMRNKILVYLNELSDDNELVGSDDLEDCKEKAKKPAQTVIDYLEENNGEVLNRLVRYKSHRCLYIYIKCLWLKLTGNLLLENKQKPALNRGSWDKIYNICNKYLNCFEDRSDLNIKPAVRLLYAYYNWVYNEKADFKLDIGRQLELCSATLGSQSIYRRLGVCDEKGELRRFTVGIYEEDRKGKERYKAKVEPNEYNKIAAARKGIYIPDDAFRKIFNGETPHPIQTISDNAPTVNIWFNGKNPQIECVDETNRGEE